MSVHVLHGCGVKHAHVEDQKLTYLRGLSLLWPLTQLDISFVSRLWHSSVQSCLQGFLFLRLQHSVCALNSACAVSSGANLSLQERMWCMDSLVLQSLKIALSDSLDCALRMVQWTQAL